jgi:hypothetical protein
VSPQASNNCFFVLTYTLFVIVDTLNVLDNLHFPILVRVINVTVLSTI